MAEHTKSHHRSYLFVFVGLIALAAISYALSFVPVGALGVPVAMLVSTFKATLVVVFFMELVAQRFVNRFVVVAAVVLLSTLIALMAADVLTRETPPMLAPSEG